MKFVKAVASTQDDMEDAFQPLVYGDKSLEVYRENFFEVWKKTPITLEDLNVPYTYYIVHGDNLNDYEHMFDEKYGHKSFEEMKSTLMKTPTSVLEVGNKRYVLDGTHRFNSGVMSKAGTFYAKIIKLSDLDINEKKKQVLKCIDRYEINNPV